MKKPLSILAALSLLAGGIFGGIKAHADLQYYPDPPHRQISADEPGPVDDMLALAKDGDPRAELILGDLYEKGKGGVVRDRKEARAWFELSAMHGYNESFIRLAAMAKHDGDLKAAWQWYTLAIDGFPSGDAQNYAIKARHDVSEEAKLDRAAIAAIRKDIRDWKDRRDKVLRGEKAPPPKQEEKNPADTAQQDNTGNPQQERNNRE